MRRARIIPARAGPTVLFYAENRGMKYRKNWIATVTIPHPCISYFFAVISLSSVPTIARSPTPASLLGTITLLLLAGIRSHDQF